MNRILVVGWGLPQAATDGASLFLQWLARRYQAAGNHVEIFTIARPEKLHEADGSRMWQIFHKDYDGIAYHVLIRPWGLLHTDPADPLRSMQEEHTRRIVLEFMRMSGGWDIVHFNAITPFEIIECVKKLGCLVRYSFHNYHLLFPIEHLFSYLKFRDNPCCDLTIYHPTGERAVAEYEALGSLHGVTDYQKRELRDRFNLLMEYGRYLINEVVDEVWGSHLRFLETARALFGLAPKNAGNFGWPLNQPVERRDGADAALRLERAPKVVIAELANIHCYKGQHILVALCDRLRDYAGRFEIRFYGGVNDTEYMASMARSLAGDPFKKAHIRFCGGYLPQDLDRIASMIHVHVSCIPLLPYISGSLLETMPRGVLPVYKEDILQRRLKEKGEYSDILWYESGNVEQLAGIINSILDRKLDVAYAYNRTAEAMRAAEALGMESPCGKP